MFYYINYIMLKGLQYEKFDIPKATYYRWLRKLSWLEEAEGFEKLRDFVDSLLEMGEVKIHKRRRR